MLKTKKKRQKKVHPTILFGSNLLSSKVCGSEKIAFLCTSLFQQQYVCSMTPFVFLIHYTTDLFFLLGDFVMCSPVGACW